MLLWTFNIPMEANQKGLALYHKKRQHTGKLLTSFRLVTPAMYVSDKNSNKWLFI